LSGYTPVFDTVFNGTMCGKWPTLPVWLTMLPLADWRGHIDMTPEAIAARTGWPIPLLLEGILALCEPDPRSRSKDDDGRRLVRLSDERDWGWRVVNIQKYREKASGAGQVADGRNAEKVKRYRDRHRPTPDDTDRHRMTPLDTNSYSDTDINKEKSKKAAQKRATRVPEDFTPDLAYAQAQVPDIDAEAEAAKFRDWEFAKPKSDWSATWRNWVRTCKESGKYSRKPKPGEVLNASGKPVQWM
jgi:hypothetical protein